MSLSQLLDRLSGFEPTGFPFISLYLNTQPDQQGKDRFDAFIRKEFRARAETYPPRSPERESFDRDVERITRYLDEELRPSTNGAAIFASAGGGDFFEAVQLDAPIEQHRLFVSQEPRLYPLARLIDQYPRYVALVADTNSARLFVFGIGTRLAETRVSNVKMTRSAIGGWSQARYQRHIDNYHLHHAKELVEALDRVVREDRIKQIVVAGDEVIVPILREQLPKHLDARVVSVLRLDINAPEHEVFRATLGAMREQDAKDDAEKVARLLDAYRGGGLGVVGVRDTLAALDDGRVEELILNASPEQIDAATDDAPSVADRLVTRALQTAARVTFVENPALLAEVGGVGALLRYRH